MHLKRLLVVCTFACVYAAPSSVSTSSGAEVNKDSILYDGPFVVGSNGPGGKATVQHHNPPATYMAILPLTQFNNPSNSTNSTDSIAGSITGMANSNGTGVLFYVDFSGFPSESKYGPFSYQIHNKPVPSDGNCTEIVVHLDPTKRGDYQCLSTEPDTCQVGDLAGKHGNITSTHFTSSYLDLYLSTNPASPYYFGDKSVVIHTSKTTLTCANFTLVS